MLLTRRLSHAWNRDTAGGLSERKTAPRATLTVALRHERPHPNTRRQTGDGGIGVISMPAAIVRLFRLFVSSYAPLALILAIQRSEHVWPLWARPAFWAFAVVGLGGLIDAYRLPRGALRKGHVRVTLSDLNDEGGQVAAYIATYLLPFIGFHISGWRDVVALVVYFAVLFLVFIRSDLALVNPALYLTGWRVTSATRNARRVLMLVPKDTRVSPGDTYAVGFGDFLVYDHEVE